MVRLQCRQRARGWPTSDQRLCRNALHRGDRHAWLVTGTTFNDRFDQIVPIRKVKLTVLVSAEQRWLQIDGVFATGVFRDCGGRRELLEGCLAGLPHPTRG